MVAHPPLERAGRHVTRGAAGGLSTLLLRLTSVVIVCAAWEYAGRVPISPAFPTFLETMAALWEMILDGSLIKAFAITLEPLVVGLAASVIAGVGLGVVMGLNRFAEWLGAPLFIIAQAAPMAALIPMHHLRLWHRPPGQGGDGVHHGHAGDRAEFAKCRPPHADIAAGDGPVVSRPRVAADHQDHPADRRRR